MDTIVYVIIGIFVLFYIIDKKALVKPTIEQISIDEDGSLIKQVLTYEEKKLERRNELYKDILKGLQEINPLKTYRIWTYVEIPSDNRNIQLSYTKLKIPVYFKKCIEQMKKNVPELIILTPLNIKEYLPDFDIEMIHGSSTPLKLRVDILFANIS